MHGLLIIVVAKCRSFAMSVCNFLFSRSFKESETVFVVVCIFIVACYGNGCIMTSLRLWLFCYFQQNCHSYSKISLICKTIIRLN